MLTTQDQKDRFWAKVDRKGDADCWLWMAGRYPTGYGQFTFRTGTGRLTRAAHRISYSLIVGECPPLLDHICHNKVCVNPKHLRPATKKQNAENMAGPYKNTSSGYRGVYWSKRYSRWIARVRHNYQAHYLGSFLTPEAANEAAVAERNRLFTFNDHDREA